MATLDLIILVIVAVGLWRGFSAGIVREVASIFGLLLGFALGAYFMESAGSLLQTFFGLAESTAMLLGFIVVFIGVLAAVHILAYVAEYILGVLKLGAVNRVMGGALGAFKSVLLISVFFVIVNPLGYPAPETRAESTFYQPVEHLAPAAWSVISDAWPDFEAFSERLGRRVEEELSQAEFSE